MSWPAWLSLGNSQGRGRHGLITGGEAVLVIVMTTTFTPDIADKNRDVVLNLTVCEL